MEISAKKIEKAMVKYTIFEDEKQYDLDCYLIIEANDLLFFVDICDNEEAGYFEDFKGVCNIDEKNSVLIINNSNSRLVEISKFQNDSEIISYVESLPKWNKTKYYLTLNNFGLSRLKLHECETKKFIDDEDKINEILEMNGFKRIVLWSNVNEMKDRKQLEYMN